MDGMTLIKEARSVGLTVTAEGDRLVIRGPKSAEPVARRLIENKPVVMQALASSSPELPPQPESRINHVCELSRRDDAWVWRLRRLDGADAAYWAWKRAGEG